MGQPQKDHSLYVQMERLPHPTLLGGPKIKFYKLKFADYHL